LTVPPTGTIPGGRFGVDEDLEHQGHALADDVDVGAGTDGSEYIVEVSIGDSHWEVLLG
jgi:hypothetical protein